MRVFPLASCPYYVDNTHVFAVTRACKVDVVFEGSLSRSWGMADVLQSIVDVPNVQYGLLRISSPGDSFHGKILIAECSHIVAASSSDSIEGCDAYQAVRAMIELREGSFAFLDLSPEEFEELDRSLFISLHRILELYPALPESGNLMFDERALLDKIFGTEPGFAPPRPRFELPMPIPKSRIRKPVMPVVPAAPAAAPITQWNVVEPLFNNPHVTHADTAASTDFFVPEKSSMIPEYVHTPEEQRSTLNKLRALPAPKDQNWQKVLKDTTQTFLSALGLN